MVDNGCGIHTRDYENVVKKHYTSKIVEFADLDQVATFGFRGEALSALCQLSGKLTVFTRTQTDTMGSVLEFDGMGQLTSQVGLTHTHRARIVEISSIDEQSTPCGDHRHGRAIV